MPKEVLHSGWLVLGVTIFVSSWAQPMTAEEKGEGQGPVTGHVNTTSLRPLYADGSVSFMLYAKDLATGYDHFNSQPDPYVIFYKNSGLDRSWVKLLETQAMIDSRRPSWPEIFVDPEPKLNAGQEWRFDVFDFDPIGEDDYMGSVRMPIEEFLGTNASFVPKRIQPSLNPTSGYLILYKPDAKIKIF